METALLACLYLAPVLIVFAAMAWVADKLEKKDQARGEK
jgi:hypothetical protein